MSEVFLASDTVNKCIQPYSSEETCVPISVAGNRVYTCTEIAQEQYVLGKLLPLSPPSLPQPHHSQGLGEPRRFGHGVETTEAQHAWMPWVCFFNGSEPFSHFFSFLVVLHLIQFLSWAHIAMRAPLSSQRLERPPGAENGLLERTRSALPMQQGRGRVAGLHSSPIQHPLGSAAELVTDDNLFLALVPSKLWQEQGRKLGDGWGCNPSGEPAAGSDSETDHSPWRSAGTEWAEEPRLCHHGGQSSSMGLVLENTFSQSVMKSLHPSALLHAKGIVAPGSWLNMPGKRPNGWIVAKTNTR